MDETAATRMMTWIAARHAEGRTVYATTYLRSIKITPKRAADCLRLCGSHVEVRMGKRWDSIMGCKITAA